MTRTQVKKNSLRFKGGTSDKVYIITLTKDRNDRYYLTTEWGKHAFFIAPNKNLTNSTLEFDSFNMAIKSYDKKLASKIKKGYKPMEDKKNSPDIVENESTIFDKSKTSKTKRLTL